MYDLSGKKARSGTRKLRPVAIANTPVGRLPGVHATSPTGDGQHG